MKWKKVTKLSFMMISKISALQGLIIGPHQPPTKHVDGNIPCHMRTAAVLVRVNIARQYNHKHELKQGTTSQSNTRKLLS